MSTAARVSRTGEYSGFSEAVYDGWERRSQYVPVRDGTRLALDVFRPTLDGEPEALPLPVAWTAKRYLRATVEDGVLGRTLLDDPAAALLSAHGYVVAAADMRGTGASFGTRTETSAPADSLDGHDLTEWLAAQPWCDGVVGMFGISYEGRLQLNTASAQPPHLRAIVPEVSPFDWYGLVQQGGRHTTRFLDYVTRFQGCDLDPPAAPVDGDTDGALLAAALREHREGNDYTALTGALPFRDSTNAAGVAQWLEHGGERLLDAIVASGVASYHRTGWFANVRLDQLLWFSNLARSATGDRHRLLVGPWGAGGVPGAHRGLWAVETLRFLDHWLRGIDNGIMDEPAVTYTTPASTRNRSDLCWRRSATWPPGGGERLQLHLGPGPSGTVASVNDGALLPAPAVVAAGDALAVDPSLTAPAGDGGDGEDAGSSFVPYDERCLTYTGPPLDDDLEVTGHPTVDLFLSCDGDDCDAIVHLLDVAPDGVSTFVTRMVQRASLRAVAEPPFDALGLRWHPCTEESRQPLAPGEVVEVALDLLPVSYRFRAGHRLRVTIAGADASVAELPAGWEPCALAVHHGPSAPSRIVLPTA